MAAAVADFFFFTIFRRRPPAFPCRDRDLPAEPGRRAAVLANVVDGFDAFFAPLSPPSPVMVLVSPSSAHGSLALTPLSV